jgi:hypothetical protein
MIGFCYFEPPLPPNETSLYRSDKMSLSTSSFSTTCYKIYGQFHQTYVASATLTSPPNTGIPSSETRTALLLLAEKTALSDTGTALPATRKTLPHAGTALQDTWTALQDT